jgi:hypothetical protein
MTRDPLTQSLEASGYAFVQAREMREALESCGPLSDWPAFAASWDHLEIDPYLAGHGRYRRRRFGVFAIDATGAVERQPHQPHYQGQEYNRLFGGVERWFEPIAEDVARSATMGTILRWCNRLFSELTPTPDAGGNRRVPADPPWHVEVHQFRIEARAEAAGHPTPEGAHRDGVDFVLVLLVTRDNIVSGTTTVFDRDGAPLGTFTLTDPCDAALVDDHRVAHGVTPVAPSDPARPGHRDVLVVTFKRRSG